VQPWGGILSRPSRFVWAEVVRVGAGLEGEEEALAEPERVDEVLVVVQEVAVADCLKVASRCRYSKSRPAVAHPTILNGKYDIYGICCLPEINERKPVTDWASFPASFSEHCSL
jgi:hypothetical protein